MRTPTLLKLIRAFEGLFLHAYICPAGIPSIGYGSTGPDIKLGLVWTEPQAEARMESDAAAFAAGAAALCPAVANNEPALSAVASFAYNLGLTRLKGSTFRRKLNMRDWDGARRECLKWVRGGGRVLPGLVRRRQAEAALLPR